jgi:opacity protein-like surface antigen
MHFSSLSSLPRRRTCLALLAWMLACGAAFAQDAPLPIDRASVRLGGYYANVDTDVSATDKSGFLSGNINLEDDLGFRHSKEVPRVRADFLFGEHQGLALDYYSVDRSSQRTLSRDASYGGVDYHAAADVHARLDFDFGSVAWRWWFGQGSDAYGVGLGGAWYRVKTDVNGEGTFDPGTGQAETQPFDSSSDDKAWAPMLQLGWRHAFNDQWRVYLDASGVRKNGGRLSGHIYNGALGIEWLPTEHVGVGLEYDYSQIRLDWRRRAYDSALDMSLSGPSAYVKLRF